jgi:hypothetical protein
LTAGGCSAALWRFASNLPWVQQTVNWLDVIAAYANSGQSLPIG